MTNWQAGLYDYNEYVEESNCIKNCSKNIKNTWKDINPFRLRAFIFGLLLVRDEGFKENDEAHSDENDEGLKSKIR